MCYKNKWQKKKKKKEKKRSFSAGNVCQDERGTRSSARWAPAGSAVLTGFPHHRPLPLPHLCFLRSGNGEIVLECMHNREGVRRSSTRLGAGVDKRICPRRCSSDFSIVLGPTLHRQDVCSQRVESGTCWIIMKLTGPHVHTVYGLVLFNTEFTRSVLKHLLFVGLGAGCSIYVSLLLCIWRLFHHWPRRAKIFSLANYKSRSSVFKKLRFYCISLSLLM